MRKGARCDIQVHGKSETTGVTKCCRPSKNLISNEVFDTCAICGYGSRLKKKNNFLVIDRASVQQGIFINMRKMKCADSGGDLTSKFTQRLDESSSKILQHDVIARREKKKKKKKKKKMMMMM